MTRRSPIIIKAEISPGTEDKDACKELVGTAQSLGIAVTADLNGVRMTAWPNSTFETVWKSYCLNARLRQ